MKSTIYEQRNIGTGVAYIHCVNNTGTEKKTWIIPTCWQSPFYMVHIGMIKRMEKTDMKIEEAVAVALANKIINLAIVESFGESKMWKWGVHTPSVLSDEELEQEEQEALESFLCGHMADICVKDYDGTVDVQIEVGNDINPLYLNRHEGH